MRHPVVASTPQNSNSEIFKMIEFETPLAESEAFCGEEVCVFPEPHEVESENPAEITLAEEEI